MILLTAKAGYRVAEDGVMWDGDCFLEKCTPD